MNVQISQLNSQYLLTAGEFEVSLGIVEHADRLFTLIEATDDLDRLLLVLVVLKSLVIIEDIMDAEVFVFTRQDGFLRPPQFGLERLLLSRHFLGFFLVGQLMGGVSSFALLDAQLEFLHLFPQDSLFSLMLGLQLKILSLGHAERVGKLRPLLFPFERVNLGAGKFVNLAIELRLHFLLRFLELFILEFTFLLEFLRTVTLHAQLGLQLKDDFVVITLVALEKLVIDEVERLSPLKALLNEVASVERSLASMVSFVLDVLDLRLLELKSRPAILPQNVEIGIQALALHVILDSCITRTFGLAAVFNCPTTPDLKAGIDTVQDILVLFSPDQLRVQNLHLVLQVSVHRSQFDNSTLSLMKQRSLDQKLAFEIRLFHGNLRILLLELDVQSLQPSFLHLQLISPHPGGLSFRTGNPFSLSGPSASLNSIGTLGSKLDSPLLELLDFNTESLNLLITDKHDFLRNLSTGFFRITFLGQLDHSEAGLAQLTVGNLQLFLDLFAAPFSGLELGNGDGLGMFRFIQMVDNLGQGLEQVITFGVGNVKVSSDTLPGLDDLTPVGGVVVLDVDVCHLSEEIFIADHSGINILNGRKLMLMDLMLVDEVVQVESLGQSGDGFGIDEFRWRDSSHRGLFGPGHKSSLHDAIGTVGTIGVIDFIGALFRQGELSRSLNSDNHFGGI
ncbi:hypothetical protein N7490_005251 [Penicillium lividum]|nr:hypothetical protein N7490_005251 [Penicillium lividum]